MGAWHKGGQKWGGRSGAFKEKGLQSAKSIPSWLLKLMKPPPLEQLGGGGICTGVGPHPVSLNHRHSTAAEGRSGGPSHVCEFVRHVCV